MVYLLTRCRGLGVYLQQHPGVSDPRMYIYDLA